MHDDIGQVVSWGLSPRVVEAWRSAGLVRLLPLQQRALREHGFLHGRDLLVVAPTASGKTFVGEMAAVKQLERNRRVVYLVPTRALAEEKFREFRDRYGPLGYRVAVATRERRDADGRVMEGRFDLLVAVYEKMKAYLVSRPEMLGAVGLIVADEVQCVAEPGRGGMIDLLLTKIAQSPYSCQLMALSAVVGSDASRLADWLGCELLEYGARPVELREGVYDASRGVFRYRCFNEGTEGDERLGPGMEAGWELAEEEMADFGRRAIFDLVDVLAREKGEQVLVFVPTRYTSRNWAHRLAARLALPPADRLLQEVRACESSHSREWLCETVRQGVAFHNADVPWDVRELIEHHFNAGSLRVLVSTSTLGQGVNLSGRNVIHVGAMVATDGWAGRQAMVALSRRRFRNQGGRGARSGATADFGRSILVARHADEAERLLARYVRDNLETLEGCIGDAEIESCVLDLVVSRVARGPDALVEMLGRTFSGRQRWERASADLGGRIARAAAALCEAGFLTGDSGEGLVATALGEVAAGTGLSRATIERLVEWIGQEPSGIGDAPLEALLAMASTRDGRDFCIGGWGDARGRRAEAMVTSVRERLRERNDALSPMAAALLSPTGGFSRAGFGDVRKACILDRWISEADTREIEEEHGICSGTAANLALHFAWIAQGAAALAHAFVAPAETASALETLVDRLVLGAGVEALGLKGLRVRGLSRSGIRSLVREGYATAADVAAAPEGALEGLMADRIARRLADEARRLLADRADTAVAPQEASEQGARSCEEEPGGGSVSSSPTSPQAVLEVDARGTGRARFAGRRLDLPPLAFRLLSLLARSPRVGVAYEDIETYLWPDAHVERQQVHSHRRRILSALEPLLGRKEARQTVEVKAGRGLVLNMDRSEVRLTDA